MLILYRGVEFQIRSHESHPLVQYPLSLDQRLAQGDAFRKTKERLEASLASIEQFYSTPESGTHSGKPTGCNRCDGKKRQIRQAFHEYYLSPEPDRWAAGHQQYREEMSRMFQDENISLQEIYDFHSTTLREHLKADFAASLPHDNMKNSPFREEFLNYVWDKDVPLKDILSFYSKHQHKISDSQDTVDFVEQLQTSKTAEERAQIYTKYYCTVGFSDSAVLKNFKSKYGRQFAELQSHDTVLAAMREESERYQSNTLEELKGKLNEFQMAKSASMKDKKRKAEQADQRMLDRDVEDNQYVNCGLPSCPLDVDLSEETIECVICDWLVRKGAAKHRVFYCSVEHADEDFVSCLWNGLSDKLSNDLSFRTTTTETSTSARWDIVVTSILKLVHLERQVLVASAQTVQITT